MSSSEQQTPPPPPPPQTVNHELSDSFTILLVLKVIIIAVFVLPIAQYFIFNSNKGGNSTTEAILTSSEELLNDSTKDTIKNATIPVRIVVQQPACPRSHLLVILHEICNELFIKSELCTPEDFHNEAKHRLPRIVAHNNSTASEPRGTIVGYFAIGLLLASLGAAFVELYKAKSQTPTKQKKHPLSRKCSLADLTVLKHHRKELIRRESILEVAEDGGGFKSLGYRPPPLNRRCSFPVGPGFVDSRRPSIESRRCSIIESRRDSFLDNSRRQSILDLNRRTSVFDDDLQERRHRSKLVHRY